MRIPFIISFMVFIASAIFFLVAVPVNCGLSNPIFDSSHDDTPYIEQMRGIINSLDTYDKVDFLLMVVSGTTSFITRIIGKHRGDFY